MDTLVFSGTRLTDLEAVLLEAGNVQRVVMRKSYADIFPGWVDRLLSRYGAECVLLTENEPLALGTFTMCFEDKGVILMKKGWTMNCGGEAQAGSVYVVPYASNGNLRRAKEAAEIIYAQPYAQRGLDEPVINGYNIIRHGAWVKRWP